LQLKDNCLIVAKRCVSFDIRDSETDESILFKIRRSDEMSKVFKAYAERKGVDVSTFHFLLDGKHVQETDTPLSLGLEDNDQIDVVMNNDSISSDDSSHALTKKALSGDKEDEEEPMSIQANQERTTDELNKVDGSASKIRIAIATESGDSATFSVSLLDTIHSLKHQVNHKWDILPSQQRLGFKTKQDLKNECTLYDYNIQNGDRLQLFTRKAPTLELPIAVEGCGINEINGIYNRQGVCDGVPKYVNQCRHQERDEKFTLFRRKLTDETR